MITPASKQNKQRTKIKRENEYALMRSFLMGGILAIMIMALTGCSNTLEGMGQDIERAGQTIQNTF